MIKSQSSPGFRRRLLLWIGTGSLAVLAALLAIVLIMMNRAAPMLKSRIIETLQASYHGRVELDILDVVAWRGFQVAGGNLRIYPPETLAVHGTNQPLIALKHFDFHAPLLGLFAKPMHVSAIEVDGLEIDIPPAQLRPAAATAAGAENKHGTIQILADEIVCADSRLVIENANPDKGPKNFALRRIELHNVGPNAPWQYTAALTNAVPRGEIEAAGNFGPWQADSPADSAVSGHYTFQHADLKTINGLGGILSSTGDFAGKLNHILVDGTTETPNFSLDTANHPIPLHTRFHAIVDGITGDTYLQPVQATLRNSNFTARGSVVGIKGKGREIDLDVDVPAGRLQDFLDLTVRTQPAVLTAVIGTKAHMHIRPGKDRVAQKLSIQGRFTLRGMHFTNPQTQDKVDMLSFRARGEPEKAKPGAEDVTALMTGDFSLQQSTLDFKRLAYTLPGAQVNLQGTYSLDGQVFDFCGHVLTSVPLSKMVASRWASLALRAVNPLFRRKGGGADFPVWISGTRSEPKFGLDVLGHHDSKCL
jgi:hypothetical protein